MHLKSGESMSFKDKMDNKEREFHERLGDLGYSGKEIEIVVKLLQLSDEYVTNPKSNEFKNAATRIINHYSNAIENGED